MKSAIKPLLITILLLSSKLIFSQSPVDPGQDPGITVPINDYLIPMIIFGIVFSFFLLKKKKTAL